MNIESTWNRLWSYYGKDIYIYIYKHLYDALFNVSILLCVGVCIWIDGKYNECKQYSCYMYIKFINMNYTKSNINYIHLLYIIPPHVLNTLLYTRFLIKRKEKINCETCMHIIVLLQNDTLFEKHSLYTHTHITCNVTWCDVMLLHSFSIFTE